MAIRKRHYWSNSDHFLFFTRQNRDLFLSSSQSGGGQYRNFVLHLVLKDLDVKLGIARGSDRQFRPRFHIGRVDQLQSTFTEKNAPSAADGFASFRTFRCETLDRLDLLSRDIVIEFQNQLSYLLNPFDILRCFLIWTCLDSFRTKTNFFWSVQCSLALCKTLDSEWQEMMINAIVNF